jgi:hypothetical protein
MQEVQMLRLRVVRMCLALGLLAWPTQAHAWWDFIEGFSGPQKFYGWDIQVRLFCLVDTVTETRDAGGRTTRVVGERAERQIPSAIGVIVSACKVKQTETRSNGETYYVRRLTVDVGARFLHANDSDFAGGERIDFTTLEPAISINLFSKWPRWDFVDYGFGAGAYWFSSTQFPSFNGAFIEPARFEFHPTTKMKRNRLSSLIPSLRVGLLYFPAGFETAAWLARPGIAPRIGRERVLNLAVFLDLEPLLR